MAKRIPGLRKKGQIWHIDKQIRGYGRLCESTRTGDREAAERYLIRRLAEIETEARNRRERHTFREATTRYLNEHMHKRSIARDADCLKNVDPHIGDLPLDEIHMGTLQPYIDARRQAGIKSATVKRELAVVRRVLTLSARLWRDRYNRPWLDTVPMFQMPNWEDSAEPYPLNAEEQRRLLQALPDHLAAMALLAVNTGLREQVVCWLRWGWKTRIPELDATVFVVPGRRIRYGDGMWPGTKNKSDQVVVLNRVARSVIEGQRFLHPEDVFCYRGKRIGHMHSTAWKRAWAEAGLPTDGRYNKGPHNLRHTFGRRLRAAGVPLETRKALLHHTDGDVTLHYSPAELGELIAAVERLADIESGKTPPVTLLRKNFAVSS
ncbi:hypothetical protein MIT9_P0941 [Methylomarinovum caldicuralii]|uniref:Tyr recombinase domain-containing protein n=1 Tax=Methylomarinovum caldicuralii TaxID=438856 RepID=A0AAU9BRE2_9GAMM|nr:tyrosine-type recombinase/integrase [Methylomarinovum caldicuralii]BCX81363.1 hypothetical protein MIT9_P0941 [Methylomarinovum caldicuralii]